MAVTINYSFPENQLRALYLDEHKKILDLLILMRKEMIFQNIILKKILGDQFLKMR